MNKEEIISSGLLEQYALGCTSSEETKLVERLLATDSSIREALNEIEKGIEMLAFDASISPGDDVKKELFKKIGKDTTSTDKEIEKPKAKVISYPYWPYVAAACFLGMVFSAFLAFSYKSALDETKQKLAIATQNELILTEKIQNVSSKLEKMQLTAFERVVLKGTELSPEATAEVFWNKNSKEVYLSSNQLPEIAESYQYQLWAIVDGKPVDMGVFDYADSQSSYVKMKTTAKAQAFAVTREPKGGSASPTLEQMVVLAEVKPNSKKV